MRQRILAILFLFMLLPVSYSFAGVLSSWGEGSYRYGQLNVPPGSDYIAVATDFAAYHCLALKSDGSVAAWGQNEYGQCDVPAPNGNFIAIAAGMQHSLALKDDNSLVAWGSNGAGQCDVPAGNDFVAISANSYGSMALKSDGTIIAWGTIGATAGNGYVAIDCGGSQNLALKSDGTIIMWGFPPEPPAGSYGAISAGYGHSLGLTDSYAIAGWGANDLGQINVPSGNDFQAISAGHGHSLAIKTDGSLVAWGDNSKGQCDAPGGNNYVAIAAGERCSFAIIDASGAIQSDWRGGGQGTWNQPTNWNPPIVPHNGIGAWYNVIIDSGMAHTNIRIENDRTIQKMDSFGDVTLTALTKDWNSPRLKIIEGLTNHGEMSIQTDPHSEGLFTVESDIHNISGSEMELKGIQIDGDITNEADYFALEGCVLINGDVSNLQAGMIEIDNESWSVKSESIQNGVVEIDGSLNNEGVVRIVPGGDLDIENTSHNSGMISIFGGQHGCEILDNGSNGVINGFGILYCGQQMVNNGTVEAMGGTLRIPTTGILTNMETGVFRNQPSATITPFFLGPPQNANDFVNNGRIEVNAGGGIAMGGGIELVNQTGGSIELLGGTLSTEHLHQKAGASFQGLGNITGDVTIESGGAMTLTGTSNIFGDVTIESTATLEVKDGTTYIYGDLINNGTILLTGGHIICKGTFTNNGSVNEQQSTRNSVSDYNLDGRVDMTDYACFAQNWMWQNQIQ